MDIRQRETLITKTPHGDSNRIIISTNASASEASLTIFFKKINLNSDPSTY